MRDGLLHATSQRSHGNRLLVSIRVLATLLLVKVFCGILAEYPGYFPADFNSPFLSGRRYTFNGIYPAAFYLHITSGPVCLALAAFQLWSGAGRSLRWRKFHRAIGKGLAVLVIAVMLPSGLVMSARAYGGIVSAAGFAVQTLLTALAIVLTAWTAKRGALRSHQLWAKRSFVLLVSPLVLRLVSGLLITLDCETETAYQLNAWVSWLVPLTLFELYQRSARAPTRPCLSAPLLSSSGSSS